MGAFRLYEKIFFSEKIPCMICIFPIEESILLLDSKKKRKNMTEISRSIIQMDDLDIKRKELSKTTPKQIKNALSQYLTPCSIADLMASMFDVSNMRDCSILDPGAGVGVLANALARHILQIDNSHISSITAVELDERLIYDLSRILKHIECNDINIIQGDFLEKALEWIQFAPNKRFSHIILNPPYKKISTSSIQRKLLRSAGIETVNLYSGFVGLCIMLLKKQGELVAIIPRSFCNGPYYKPFRKIILKNTQIKQIHLFGSRRKNFSDDNVLQENVIIRIQKESPCIHKVKISHSTDSSLYDYVEDMYSSEDIVNTDDPEFFIRIPDHISQEASFQESNIHSTLQSLSLSVSTGPIVDFRTRQYLSQNPQDGTVPLIYPMHLQMTKCIWPQASAKKPNSIFSNIETQKMLFPCGYYCVVKRFSSKEEKRRIFASVISPDDFCETKFLGFENHLNIFHHEKQGLDKDIAFGLMVFLNSDWVDRYFRTFNGHTQVNATDLRQMYYPTINELRKLGCWAQQQRILSIELIDQHVEKTLCLNNITNK